MRRITLLLVCMAVMVCAVAAVAYARQINGTNQGETIIGTANNDQISARGGGDLVKAKAGNDTVFGGDGSDDLLGQRGNDELHGGDGADTLKGNAGDDDLFGEAGNDTIIGGSGADELFGGTGDDFLNSVDGLAGNDSVFAGENLFDDDTCRVDLDDKDNDGNLDINEEVDEFSGCENRIFVDTNQNLP
jgi:Ca2+-binding RTX toxin-like protein